MYELTGNETIRERGSTMKDITLIGYRYYLAYQNYENAMEEHIIYEETIIEEN